MIEIILQHLHWYPLMGPRDIYKLIYQGVLGSEHLISSPEGFSSYLAEEFAPLLPDPNGRLLEPLRPDQTILRINLRPYKALEKPVDKLIPALLETARLFKGDSIELRDTWRGFVHACEQGTVSGFEPGELHQFTSWLEGMNFPAVHHSDIYMRAYQPAYRLISAQLTAQLRLGEAR